MHRCIDPPVCEEDRLEWEFFAKESGARFVGGKIYGYAKNKSTGEVCTVTANWLGRRALIE